MTKIFFLILISTVVRLANSEVFSYLPSQGLYNLTREGISFTMTCKFEDGGVFDECGWSRNNKSLAKVRKVNGNHRTAEDQDLLFHDQLGIYKVNNTAAECFLELFNVSLERDEGDWRCKLMRANPPEESFPPGDVDHVHTGMQIQFTDVYLEVLRDPKLDIRVHNSTDNDVTTFYPNLTYLVDCTAEGGSPKVQSSYALFKARHSKNPRQLEYITAKASAELDSVELRLTRRFIFSPKLEDALNGGGELVCIFEQSTKSKFVLSEKIQDVNNSILFGPFLADKKDGMTVVNTKFEEKVFHISANPPPDLNRGIKLTINKNPDVENEKCKNSKKNTPAVSEIFLNHTFQNNIVSFVVSNNDLTNLLGSEDVAQCDFKIEVATSLAKIELFISFQDSENSYLQVPVIIIIAITILCFTILCLCTWFIYKSRSNTKKKKLALAIEEKEWEILQWEMKYLAENKSFLKEEPSDHRRLDRSQTWCVGDKPVDTRNSPAYSRKEIEQQRKPSIRPSKLLK